MKNTFFTNSLIQQLKTLNIILEKEVNNGLRKLNTNLTGTQVAVLMLLYQNSDNTVTQKQVELALKLSHPTTRGIVKRLITTGLIKAVPAPQDQRQIALSLTPAGAWFLTEKADTIKEQVVKTENRLVSRLSVADQADLKRLIATILDTMS